MKTTPTQEEAHEAQHMLEVAILKFSDEARAPWERGTPNPDPHWKPRPSTLRYQYLRGGGWIWQMTSDDPQIVAYYVNPTSQDPYVRVTAHGQARHNFYVGLKERRIFPTGSVWPEWYGYRERYQMEHTEPRRRY